MAHLTISLLGPPEVKLDDSPVTTLVTSRARALLAYLAVEPGRTHRRESLAGLLWPDWPERSARTNLRNTLSSLRKAIGDQDADPSFLIVTRETIQFNAASDCWIDVGTFGQLIDAAHGVDTAASHQLEKAIALYRGPFLEGFSIDDSPVFEDWALSVRDRLAQEHLAALQRLGECYEHSSDYERASEIVRRWAALAPWHEQAHQALMRLLALNGQRGAALAQYEACRRALREELDVGPGEETTRLYERIRDGELMPRQKAGARDISPAPPSPSSKPSPRSQQIPSPPPPAQPTTSPEGPVPLAGERRLATVLMADVKGSTALAEQVDVEEWVEMMNEVLQILSAEVYRYGGEVDQYRGDGLVAFFGVPAAHEDDPERAVLAALAMQEAIGRYAADLAEREGIELLLRVGLNTGEVIATHVGDDRQHGEDTAIFGQMFLNGGTYGGARILSPASVAEMTRNQIPGIGASWGDEFFPEASWGLSWNILGDKKPPEDGTLRSARTFGKGGAGGTFTWVDPVYEIVGIYFAVGLDPWFGCVDLFKNAVTAAVTDL